MLIAALTLALLAPQDPQVVDGVIVQPVWVAVPGIEHMAPRIGRTEYFPHGTVQMLCKVVAAARLEGCAVTVAPADYPELGALALDASKQFRHRLELKDGRSAVGMKIRVTMVWQTPE